MSKWNLSNTHVKVFLKQHPSTIEVEIHGSERTYELFLNCNLEDLSF